MSKEGFKYMTAIFYFTKKEETRPMVSNRPNTIARVCDNIDLKCKIICPFKISAFAGMTNYANLFISLCIALESFPCSTISPDKEVG